jgi:bifunctional UDP-N-acetylglucosamine pyrophosphorylase/glucosamine-1-phosphate N-acetyltransferase
MKAIVLAAGRGTRMRSALPKVLHRAAGRPLLGWVLDAARSAGCDEMVVVVGHGAEEVKRRFPEADLRWVVQEEQCGTGDAVTRTREMLSGYSGPVLVLSGDVPLVRPQTLRRLLERAADDSWALAVSSLDDPGSLGRVIRDTAGRLVRIVEAADASPEELGVDLVNAGHYALPVPALFAYLERLEPDGRKGELYLTHAIVAAARQGESVHCLELEDPAEALGVNDRQDLARVYTELIARRLDELMTAGVTILDPLRTVVEAEVEVAADTVLHPGVSLLAGTRIGGGCELHQGAWLRASHLGDGVEVGPYSVLDGAQVGNGCRIGPFARLRPGAELAGGVHIGNFVEVKNSRLGTGVKANHLAYLGDATIGERANIGAGVVTCNYDGEQKHRTEIGDDAFIGSDTMLVAPVRVGAGALTAAGSVITKNVPENALAIARSPQRTREEWAKRRRGSRKTKA